MPWRSARRTLVPWWRLALGIVGIPAIAVVAPLARLAFTKRTLGQTSHPA